MPSRGIAETLSAMAGLIKLNGDAPEYRELAERLSDPFTSRAEEMKAFVDELHRRFVYAPDPIRGEFIGPIPFESGPPIDADDACLFVAALARNVGIRCRFVAARYGRAWTCLVEYEEADGSWTLVEPLRQAGDRTPDELLRGPIVDV